MAVARMYGLGIKGLALGRFNVGTDTFKCSLHSATYVPNGDTHEYWSSATNEVSGPGYTAGGVALTSVAATWSAGDQALKLTCANPTWVNATLTGVRIAVFYKVGGSAATSPLLAYIDFESDQSVTGADVSITLPTSGFAQITRL